MRRLNGPAGFLVASVSFVLACAVPCAGAHGENGDGEYMELRSRLAFGPGRAVASFGDTACVANGGYLDIVDFSILTDPVLIGRLIFLDQIMDIAVEGDYVYVANNRRGLRVVDISDPAAPFEAGSLTLGTYGAVGIDLSDGYAWIAGSSDGIRVVDISDPANPSEIGGFDTIGSAGNVAVSGSYLYAAYQSYGLRIIDVSDPENPVEAGLWETADNVRDVDVSGSFAYVADYGAGLRVIDVSDPAAPAARDSIDIMYSYAGNVTFSDGYAYVSFGIHGMRIIDVSDPDAIILAGTHYQYENNIYRISVSGGLAFAADDVHGLKVLDVSNPSSAFEAGDYETFGFSESICVSSTYCYVSCWDQGFGIAEISDPDNPVPIARYDEVDARSIFISGNLAYIAGYYDGLRIYDITSTTAAHEIGFYDTRGTAYEVVVESGLAYIADGTEGLLVLDVSDPASPDSVGAIATYHIAMALEVSGGYAYVADYNTGLRVIDVSNPAAPVETDFYDTPGAARDVAVSGGYAYVVDWSEGVSVIDVSDPGDIFLADRYTSAMITNGIAISGNFAYVAAGAEGVEMLDITDPANVRRAGWWDTGGSAVSVCVSAGQDIYVADGIDGIYIFSSPLVGTLLAGFEAAGEAGGVRIEWELTEPVAAADLTISRKIGSDGFRVLEADIERDDTSYRCIDATAAAGRSYIYRLEIAEDGRSRVLFETGSVEMPLPAPALLQNHPNPFNPSTTIGFFLPARERARVEIYDVRGGLVAVLVDRVMDAGEHTAVWDGRDSTGGSAASGVYFCRLTAGKKSISRKMVLLR